MRSPESLASGSVAVHLIRHAHAGKRSSWADDDTQRPLSPRGREQAEGLADLLADEPVTRIVSSPYLRCVQTMEPLAARLGLAVEAHPALAEGADPDAATALLDELVASHGVACSHGDVIPLVLRRLQATGTEIEGPLLDQKGSTWVLAVEGGRMVRGRYVRPLA